MFCSAVKYCEGSVVGVPTGHLRACWEGGGGQASQAWVTPSELENNSGSGAHPKHSHVFGEEQHRGDGPGRVPSGGDRLLDFVGGGGGVVAADEREEL